MNISAPAELASSSLAARPALHVTLLAAVLVVVLAVYLLLRRRRRDADRDPSDAGHGHGAGSGRRGPTDPEGLA